MFGLIIQPNIRIKIIYCSLYSCIIQGIKDEMSNQYYKIQSKTLFFISSIILLIW